MDFLIAKSVLDKHLCGVCKQAQSTRTFYQFHILCTELVNSTQVVYPGLASPFFATSNGIYLATPSVFTEQDIKTVYFASCLEIESPDSNLADTLLEDEALMFRNAAAGKQDYLAWLRGALPENALKNFYSGDVLPRLKNDSTISLLRDVNWRYANEKRRISQHVLKYLKSAASENNYMEVIAGDTKKAKALAPRCKDILRILGKNAEIVAWSLDSEQPHAEAKSLLIETLISITGGTFLAEFDPKSPQ